MTRGYAMLCAKAWRESRGRFAVSALVVGGLCAVMLVFQAFFRARMVELGASPTSYVVYVHGRIYGGVVRSLFVILAILLGLGGLQRERTQRTIGFSLALPVHRRAHLTARAAVGLVELAALAALAALVVPVCSAAVGERYPVSQAVEFAALWLVIGAVMFAASVAISVVVRSEYAALAVALVVLRALPLVLASLPGVGRWPVQPDRLMSGRGMAYFDAATGMLAGVPWLVVAGADGLTTALLSIAARIAARDRFS